MNKLDKPVILSTAAPLKGEARRRRGLGRAIVVLLLATTMGFASASELKTADIEEKPVYDLMNVKLYLHNQINNWDQFVCANELGFRESTWRYDAVNKSSGAYGIFQHMSNSAPNWDAYKQIDKHIEYIDARYDGSWCKALDHLESRGWH
jgi:hypothetical protein